MSFDSVLGQDHAKEVLRRAVRAHRIPHALLFSGPKGVGKTALALALARVVNCQSEGPDPCGSCPPCRKIIKLTHPDVHLLFPAKRGRGEHEDVDPEVEVRIRAALSRDPYRYPGSGLSDTIPIGRVRRLQRDLAKSLHEGDCRVAIFLEPERMRRESANALLKILEEPLPNTILILATSKPNALLPTIVSRCQRIRFHPLSTEDIRKALRATTEIPEASLSIISRLCQGSLSRAYQLEGQDVENLRNQAYIFLHDGLFRDDMAVVPLIEKWTRDRNPIEELFEPIGIWLRDVFLFREGFTQSLLFEDRIRDIKKLAPPLNPEAVFETLAELERCRDMYRRNVNISLILLALWAQIRRTRMKSLD